MTGCLMVQVAARESLDVLRLADRPGGGLVFTGAGAIEAVHAARRQGFERPMLTDRRHGRTPDWLASASVFDANAHTFDVLFGDADRLRRLDSGPARERAWQERCRGALDRYGELDLAALGWDPARFASAWALGAAMGTAVGGTVSSRLRSAG